MSVKHKQLKRDLKTLQWDNYSDIQKRVIEATQIFTSAQVVSLQHPTSSNFYHEKTCLDRLSALKHVEKAFFKQKSRIYWLQTGDQNTSYFHKVANSMNAYN